MLSSNAFIESVDVRNAKYLTLMSIDTILEA
jgi:hypothetical protein